MTLIDSNVLLDIVTDDPEWYDWSRGQLDSLSVAGPLFINEIVYAEVSVRFAGMDDLDEVLGRVNVVRSPTPKLALFLAGKAYKRYRASGGVRTGVLPDFFIGAHAAAAGLTLLTRDARRYRSYFPTIDLIAP